MSISNKTSWPALLFSWAAMLLGLGLLVVELVTDVLHQLVPEFVIWGVYLLLLMTSVWGMKTLLEYQSSSRMPLRQGNSNASSLTNQQSHNL